MTDKKPVHAAQSRFAVIDDCLQICGIPVTRLAQRVGTTPFYAYDRRLLTDRIDELRASLPAGVCVHYSVKANPMPALVQHMARLVDGLDVASAGELKVALDTGMAVESIHFAGPGKTDSELSQAVAAGVVISVESERELERLAAVADKIGVAPSIGLRVNPDYELKSSGMKMGGGAKQFGIDVEQMPRLLRRVNDMGLRCEGLHVFSGSQSLKADAIIEAQAQTIALALRMAEHMHTPPRYLNIGGGFGIPYFPGEMPLDIAPIGQHLGYRLDELKTHLPQTKVILELGRYLVGEAGVFVSRVIDRKVSRGQVFLVTDGGLNHHLAASGNFGQVIRKNYPVIVGNKVAGAAREVASVVGPLCTPLDLIADRADMAQADIGDLIVVFQSGAYGLSASPGGFLSHPEAREVMV